MKEKYIDLYMGFAHDVAKLSYATRRQVGAVIVNDDTVIYGYNGTPEGWDNTCEDAVYNDRYIEQADGTWVDPKTNEVLHDFDEVYPHISPDGRRYYLKTRPEVLHAESNAIAKLARSVVNGEGAELFVTTSPCLECAKLIHQTKFKRVFFSEHYRTDDGIKFLEKAGIDIVHRPRQ